MIRKNPFAADFKLGILGGGQLGRMLLQSAIDFNLNVKILDPNEHAPCRHLVKEFQCGELTDFETVTSFGHDCDVVSIEIENVNTAALKELEKQGKKVFPQPEIIELIQDKRTQKQFYKNRQIPTSDFILTKNKDEVKAHSHFLPAVSKLGKAGYDGSGVQILRSESDLEKAFDQPGLLEKLVDFDKEIAVIVARNEKGETAAYPATELHFHPSANLVEYLFSPSEVKIEIEKKAKQLAIKVINELGMIGLLAVEMFVTKDGHVLVNEVAPRTHNSGHHSIEANMTSQFEQHLRAILNLPLGDTSLKVPAAAMVNLLGEEGHVGDAKYQGIKDVMEIKGAKIHLYGKRKTKPFRKMGHVTITGETLALLREKVTFIKNTLKIIT